jgi:hypothetical protein
MLDVRYQRPRAGAWPHPLAHVTPSSHRSALTPVADADLVNASTSRLWPSATAPPVLGGDGHRLRIENVPFDAKVPPSTSR